MKGKYLSTSNNEPITFNSPGQSGRRESDSSDWADEFC
jgi:hypothetical protein